MRPSQKRKRATPTSASKKQRAKIRLRPDEVVIDVAGVSPNTRIGDLTAKQFVQLLIQLSVQNRARAATPEVVEAIVSQVGREFQAALRGRKDSASKKIFETQLAVLERIPTAMNAVYSAQRGVKRK